ncbi:MAG: DUF1657 domain-containing protein [bacterium]|jgi:hypothetical protein
MTIGQKLHSALASAESLCADLKTFALETDNQQSKQTYAQLAQQMEGTVNTLKAQVNTAEAQEPQYKVFNQMQQGSQQPGAQMKQGSQMQSGQASWKQTGPKKY